MIMMILYLFSNFLIYRFTLFVYLFCSSKTYDYIYLRVRVFVFLISPIGPEVATSKAIELWKSIMSDPGQATASGTSAIDFGATETVWPANLPYSLSYILSHGPFGGSNENLAGCTVSRKCFLPEWAVEAFFNAFHARPLLQVFLNAVVTGTLRDPQSGRITSLTVVQRTPTPGILTKFLWIWLLI